MNLESALRERFFAALQDSGMPSVPEEFSVVPRHQTIPGPILAEIAGFIHVFDEVTTRPAWQAAALREAPAIAQFRRSEACFFSAWDFHLPPDGSFRLIEFNDNGSGFLFAPIINTLYFEAAELKHDKRIEAPLPVPALNQHLGVLVEQEAKAFFGDLPAGLFLILDDAESLKQGKFRKEHGLLCDLFRGRGWRAGITCPANIHCDGQQLLFEEEAVSFIVNRSTDFFWRSEAFSALRTAYEAGQVYVAPNPFTYATRSDKRLLEWLSLPDWDDGLGIDPLERQILSAHVPETHLVDAGNLENLVQSKHGFVFKPSHGFAGRGLLDSAAVGRSRLRRLAKHNEGYVAQKWIPKPCIEVDGATLWTDLRVWAFRGEIYLLSGRASPRPDRLELAAPGGWLPTYSAFNS